MPFARPIFIGGANTLGVKLLRIPCGVCSAAPIGDLGTIAYFQITGTPWPVWAIMSLAIVNGLITSIALETLILLRQMALISAFKTAIGMSLISMVSMEVAMNLVDVAITGGAILTLEVVPLMLLAGFVTPPALQLLAFKSPRPSLSLSAMPIWPSIGYPVRRQVTH